MADCLTEVFCYNGFLLFNFMSRLLPLIFLVLLSLNATLAGLFMLPASATIASIQQTPYVEFQELPPYIKEGFLQLYDLNPEGIKNRCLQVFAIPEELPLLEKARNAATAIKINRFIDEQSLAEIYMNVADYKSKVRGLEAASMKHFNKTPQELSLTEASYLIGLSKI